MKAQKLTTVLLLGLLAASVSAAAPSCRVFKTFNAAANTGIVQDTIVVASSFPAGSAQVSNMVLGHPAVTTLKMTLLHKATPEAQPTAYPLTASASMLGAYTPSAPVSGNAAGQWVIRIEDTQPGAEQRLISLTSWTLQLCEGAAPVTASSGDTQASASSTSASAEASTGSSSSSSPAPAGGDDKATARIGQGKVAEQAKGMLGLLFPGLKEEDMAPTGVLGAIHSVKDHVRDGTITHVADVLKLVADQSELYKGFVAKKISDAISDVNKAGGIATGLITKSGNKFGVHDKSLRGLIANIKTFVAAEAQSNVESILKMAGDLMGLHTSLTGGFKSSAGAVGQLVAASFSNMGSLYLTVEGAAKTHLNNLITAKAAVLEGLLDKIIAALAHVEGSKLTGPVVDMGLKINVAKLSALSAALDKVEAAVKALPTPSQIVTGKFSLFTGLLQQTKVYDLLTAVDEVDRPLIDGLMKKVNTARDLVRKATPEVAATSGN